MNTDCLENATICSNNGCGFQSKSVNQSLLCKNCRIKEKMSMDAEDIYDVNQTSGLQHASSITYNYDDSRFEIDTDFFRHINLADEQRAILEL